MHAGGYRHCAASKKPFRECSHHCRCERLENPLSPSPEAATVTWALVGSALRSVWLCSAKFEHDGGAEPLSARCQCASSQAETTGE